LIIKKLASRLLTVTHRLLQNETRNSAVAETRCIVQSFPLHRPHLL